MNLGDLRSLFRLRAADSVAPYLWSDDEIDDHLRESENEAAERASLIYDDTSPETVVAVVAGTTRYALDPSILRIDLAVLDNTSPLAVLDRRERSPRGLFLIPDSTSLELNFEPQAAGTLQLGVYRLPLNPMSLDTDTPEIHRKYHSKLLDWALHLAYLKPDADAFDQSKADRHEAKFIANFGQRVDANVQRKQRERRRHVVRCNW